MRDAAAQAASEEEEEGTDYSPSPTRKGRAAAPKKATQAKAGGPSHPNNKKQGGPCVICYATSKLLQTASLMFTACNVQLYMLNQSIMAALPFFRAKIPMQVLHIPSHIFINLPPPHTHPVLFFSACMLLQHLNILRVECYAGIRSGLQETCLQFSAGPFCPSFFTNSEPNLNQTHVVLFSESVFSHRKSIVST